MDLVDFVIAIDGPAGSGKTTIARSVAMELSLPHLDTGAFYRAATVAVQEAAVDPGNHRAVVDVVGAADLSYDRGRISLNGHDVSETIRTDDVTAAVSSIAAISGVRGLMVDAQRRWVADRGGSAVVEGRDIASVVFPEAKLKLFITARPEVRAARRAGEVAGDRGVIAVDLARRDQFDSTREVSPLYRADGALELDTSDLTIDEVISTVLRLVEAQR